jgi:hypothetical protein
MVNNRIEAPSTQLYTHCDDSPKKPTGKKRLDGREVNFLQRCHEKIKDQQASRPAKRVGVLEQLAALGEDDHGELRAAEDGELVGFLEKSPAALGEGHPPVHPVLHLLHLHTPAPHSDLTSRQQESFTNNDVNKSLYLIFVGGFFLNILDCF